MNVEQVVVSIGELDKLLAGMPDAGLQQSSNSIPMRCCVISSIIACKKTAPMSSVRRQ